jgi:hypothetical protein
MRGARGGRGFPEHGAAATYDRKPVRVRRGRATVTGERASLEPLPVWGGKAEGSVDPGARILRVAIVRPGAQDPEEVRLVAAARLVVDDLHGRRHLTRFPGH